MEIFPNRCLCSNLGCTDPEKLYRATLRPIDALTLAETWLDSSISDAEIKLPGFVCVRQDGMGQKEGNGGLAIYVREGLDFRLRNDINTGS